jgi:hypothetical protein
MNKNTKNKKTFLPLTKLGFCLFEFRLSENFDPKPEEEIQNFEKVYNDK